MFICCVIGSFPPSCLHVCIKIYQEMNFCWKNFSLSHLLLIFLKTLCHVMEWIYYIMKNDIYYIQIISNTCRLHKDYIRLKPSIFICLHLQDRRECRRSLWKVVLNLLLWYKFQHKVTIYRKHSLVILIVLIRNWC